MEFQLRLVAAEKDAPSIAAIYKPYVERTAITFEYEPPDASELRCRIAATLPRYPYLVCAADDGILGYAYGGALYGRAAYQWDAELSIYLREDVRGQGIGSALYKGLMTLLRAQGFVRVYACITYPNEESVGFHRRLGFTQCGHFAQSGFKFDRWHDVIWMDKLLDGVEAGVSPRPLRPVDALGEDKISAILAASVRG